MMYIALGNAIVLVLSMVNGGNFLYEFLRFDKGKVLNGEIWRLVTYVFTQSGGSILELIFLYFFYMLGRHVESNMGTFKFNLFYLSGVVLMDVYAMIFCPVIPADTVLTVDAFAYYRTAMSVYSEMAYYLHLSLILTFATLYPQSQFMVFFIIPVKAWLIALIYLFLEFIAIFNLSYPVWYFPHNLFPLVAIGNYFLFFGKDVINVIPLSWQVNLSRLFKKKPQTGQGQRPIHFHSAGSYEASTAKTKVHYTHRCTVCGRTDVSHPDLEFRYCSRCNGYYCYCEDHINHHSHVE